MSEIGPILTGDARALKGGPPVKALFIQNTNPVNVAPDQTLTRAGLCARGPLHRRPRAVHDRDGRDGRHRPARDDVPRAQRLLHAAAATRACSTAQSSSRRPARRAPTSRSSTSCCAASAATIPRWQMTDREMVAETFRRIRLRRARRDRKDRLRRARAARGRSALRQRLRLARRQISASRRTGRASRTRRATSGSAIRPSCRASPTGGTSTSRRAPSIPFRLATSPSRSFLNSSFSETAGSQKRQPTPTVFVRPDRCRAARHRRRRPRSRSATAAARSR